MAVRSVCVYPAPVLREPAEAVDRFDEELDLLVRDMFDTMYAQDGVGLAAPQVGVSKKIAVISLEDEKHVLINPEILEKTGSAVFEEGCLSFPGFYAKVPSPEFIKLKYQNIKGDILEMDVSGFLACVFSHEIDHLNSRLLIDRVSPLKRQFIKKRMLKAAGEDR